MRSLNEIGMMIEEALDKSDDDLMALLLEITPKEWGTVATCLQNVRLRTPNRKKSVKSS